VLRVHLKGASGEREDRGGEERVSLKQLVREQEVSEVQVEPAAAAGVAGDQVRQDRADHALEGSLHLQSKQLLIESRWVSRPLACIRW
jgi:hypothetical protein